MHSLDIVHGDLKAVFSDSLEISFESDTPFLLRPTCLSTMKEMLDLPTLA